MTPILLIKEVKSQNYHFIKEKPYSKLLRFSQNDVLKNGSRIPKP